MNRLTALIVGAAFIVAINSNGQGAVEEPIPVDPCEGLPAACAKGLHYWPELPSRVTTVKIVTVMPEKAGTSVGWAKWNGVSCTVYIRHSYRNQWRLYAHEFGHCHTMKHDESGDVDRPDYKGIMDYDTMWRSTNYQDDLDWYHEIH